MIRRLATLFSFAVNALAAAAVVAILVPGPHRMAMPATYGMTEIAPDVWTDAPRQAGRLTGLAAKAGARVAAFFGETPPPARLVLCTTRSCARSFGIGGNGLSVPRLGIAAAPGGLTAGTLTHEMTHAWLHRAMGPRNIFRQPFPTWFDEGLATHVADHPVWRGTVTRAARQRIRQVRRFWQWDDAYHALGVGPAYRAAAAEVAAIEQTAGRAGLLNLIRRAEAGEDFARVLAELTARR